MKNTTLKNNIFLNIGREYDLIWLGEVHGIQENYRAHDKIIRSFSEYGFKNILWEIKSGLSETSDNSEDGRVNPFAMSFLNRITRNVGEGKLESLAFFGDVEQSSNAGKFKDYEKEMAAQVIDRVKNKKTIVITGNHHMGSLINKRGGTKRCSDYVEDETGLRILKIGIKYAGGTFYNYGIKKMPKLLAFSDRDNLRFGTITKNDYDDTFFFHAGEAHAVFKSPIAK